MKTIDKLQIQILIMTLLSIFSLITNAEIYPKYVNGKVRYIEQRIDGTVKLRLCV